MQLILRAVDSPYNDITKGSVLSHQELDLNQINLKGELIITGSTDNSVLSLVKINGETIDIPINLKNRQRCIDEAHYGPLNPNEPNEDYWIAKAKMFGGDDVEAAKKAFCGNCAFFNQTKAILDCIAKGIGGQTKEEWDTIEAGDLGYCEAFDFICV